jgi:hypothetical protein
VSSGRQDSSVSIASGYRIDGWGSDPGWDILRNAHTDSGVYPVSHALSIGGSFTEGKATRAERSPPFIAKLENDGAIPPLPHTSSWHSA